MFQLIFIYSISLCSSKLGLSLITFKDATIEDSEGGEEGGAVTKALRSRYYMMLIMSTPEP